MTIYTKDFTGSFTALASFISIFIVYFAGKKKMNKEQTHRIGLDRFLKYARIHAVISILIAVILAAAAFIYGMILLYDFSIVYIVYAILILIGPFVSWILSTLFLIYLIKARGAVFSNLILASFVNIIMILAGIGLFYWGSFWG